jgi:hypothetical protein
MNGAWGEGLGWTLLLFSLIYLLRFIRNTFAASPQGCGCRGSRSCPQKPAAATQTLSFVPRQKR